MASAPVYFITPVLGQGVTPATLDTNTTAPTHVTSLLTGASTGTKITQIRCVPNATVVAGCVNIFSVIGGVYTLIDSFNVFAETVSATVTPIPLDLYYANLILPSASYSIACTTTVAGNQGLHSLTVFGVSA